MIYQDHRISVCNQIFHNTGEPLNIGRVKSDRRLVQHIQDAGSPVPHSTGKLHALPLSGG